MTDLEAREACKKVLATAATNLKDGVSALRKVREYVNSLDLGDEPEPFPSLRKFSGARDRMERNATNRGGSAA